MINILKKLKENTDIDIKSYKKLGIGQNLNYKIFDSNNNCFLLRIISNKGYPSINTLNICFDYLKQYKIYDYSIVYSDLTNEIVPYGYFILNWIEGIDGTIKYQKDDLSWVRDFALIFNKLHAYSIPYFGYLTEGPQFNSIKEYYNNIDIVINNSFGNVFKENYSLYDLKYYTSSNFIDDTLYKINKLSNQLSTTIRSVLLHGDMFPSNLIYNNDEINLIDWDETKANWWVYDLARTTFYNNNKELIEIFLKYYKYNYNSNEDIKIGIKIEQTRQLLRMLFMSCFNNSNPYEKVINLELIINDKLA